jgi:hypothetical protein
MHIPLCQRALAVAKFEQAQRAPHMVTKYDDTPKRRAGQLRGLIIEHHVYGYLVQRLGSQIIPPDNAGQWTVHCNHDFKIQTSGAMLLIDVSGPKADLSFGSYKQKPGGCHYHIIAKPVGMLSWEKIDYAQGFEVIGVVRGIDFHEKLAQDSIMPFENWLSLLEV